LGVKLAGGVRVAVRERERGKGRWAGGGVWAGREAGGVRFGPEREERELRLWECFF
jgi:hypothetical protein